MPKAVALVLERLEGLRIIANAAALDVADWPDGSRVFRLAPDDVFLLGDGEVHLEDPHAIIELETGFSGMTMEPVAALAWLEATCEWELPRQRPAFAQGAVAGLAVKLWFDEDEVFVMTASAFAAELAERMP